MATKIARTGTSSTNATKFTWSAWVKRANIGGAGIMYYNYLDGNNRGYLTFDTNDNLFYYDKDGGDEQASLTTTAKYRDCNAFYHICLIGDSTDGTQGDRIQLYVNGVRQTMTGTYPDANDSLGTKVHTGTNYHAIGTNADSTSNAFSGIISHVHYVDGIDYPATTFGSTDATTGEWKINTSPSITTSDYGNNGYFVLKDGNSGTDQSGNSHNFTVTAGTLTKTEDNPSNVFATLNPLAGSTDATFSNGNTKVTFGTASSRSIVSTTLGAINGKYYWEMKLGGSVHPNNITAGVGTKYAYDAGNTGVGGFNETWGITPWNGTVMNNGSSVGGTWATFASGDIMQLAVNLDDEQSGLNKFYIGKNGTWLNGADPSNHSSTTGVVGITKPENGSSGFLFPLFGDAGDSATPAPEVNFGNGYFGTTAVSSAGTNASGNGIFEYDVPTGFTALSTKGLNL